MLRAISVALALLAGCGGQGVPADPWLAVGTGETEFQPVEDGDEVPFFKGVQGRYHLWVSLRAGGIDPEAVQLTMRTWPEADGGPVQTSLFEEDLEPVDGDPAYELLGLIDSHAHPECLVDRRFVVRLELEDRAGTQLASERVIVPVPGPDGGPTETCSR